MANAIPPALRGIPNIGPATAGDLRRLGITELEQLRGRDPDRLYERLCAIDGVRHDPCARDVFAALVDQAAGRPAKPWFHYSRIRKANPARRRHNNL
jgi:hypothetical protein